MSQSRSLTQLFAMRGLCAGKLAASILRWRVWRGSRLTLSGCGEEFFSSFRAENF
jgi:hypothetical protein